MIFNKSLQSIPNKYNILYPDPPWQYRDTASAGERGAEYKYSCLSVERLKALPVQHVAQDNCMCFMWVTGPFMAQGIQVMESWGFEYKTIAFTWVKINKVSDSLFWGMGNYTRSNPEYVLLGLKGKVHRQAANIHSVIENPVVFYSRHEGHSYKPAIVREKIVTLCGDLPRLEMFARETCNGWDSWGDQI